MNDTVNDLAANDAGDDETAPLPILSVPREGVPDVVTTDEGLTQVVAALRSGTGPIAVDAERAQSFRYSTKAYLFQLRRAGSGTHLIDPVAFEDRDGHTQLEPLAEAMAGEEWIIHAASQDLPCLIMAGLIPTTVFDTEQAGRLLGLPRVGLGPLIEAEFGVQLLKEHSAANWSQRPIPDDWLAYAALDVELLVELRDRLREKLDEAGKLAWAEQEFAHTLSKALAPAPDPRDRWRRTTGLQYVRNRRALALVRELWDERDLLAERYDLAPGKVVQDKAITELAATMKATRSGNGRPADPPLPTRETLRRIEGFKRRNAHRFENNWIAAIERVAALSVDDLPPLKGPPTGAPNPKGWEFREPDAWARWQRVRHETQRLAEEIGMPPENLIQPDALKRITHRPPATLSSKTVDEALAALGVRPWQREQITPALVEGLALHEGDLDPDARA